MKKAFVFALLSLTTVVFANQAHATSVIGKMYGGSDGPVLLIPTTYLYIGSSIPGEGRLPDIGCVKVGGSIAYEYVGAEVSGHFTKIDSVQILPDAECDGLQ